MCAILYFFLIVWNKPHANPTIIYENIKEIHILAVGGTLDFPILSHVLLRRANKSLGILDKETTVKFLNFRMPENIPVIYLKFKQKGQTFSQKDANGIANSEDLI